MDFKIPPHDIEAEQAILSAMIQFSKTCQAITNYLTPEDFYRESHLEIFKAICEIQGEVDLVTLINCLRKKDLIEIIGGQEYIIGLIDCISTGTTWKYHADILREMKIRRDLISKSANISERCFQLTEPIEETISIWREQARGIKVEESESRDNKSFYIKVCEELFDNDKSEPGYSTGISPLDHYFYMEPGYIHCIAAESGVGKSALLLQIADHVAQKYGKVLYFSLESTDIKLASRLIARRSGIALTKIHKKHLQDSEWPVIRDTLSDLQESKLILIDSSRFSEIEKLVSYIESAAIDGNIRMIVIDFLQLLSSFKKTNSRHLEISHIITQFKYIAKQLNIPILFASQLRKDIKGRPSLDDLKESGDIRTHTDNIIFLYAPNSNPAIYEVECFLAKGKEQERFSIWLEFNGHHQEFTLGYKPDIKKKGHWQDDI